MYRPALEQSCPSVNLNHVLNGEGFEISIKNKTKNPLDFKQKLPKLL